MLLDHESHLNHVSMKGPLVPKIAVRNMEESIAFYRDMLDFNVMGVDESTNEATLRQGEAVLMLCTACGFHEEKAAYEGRAMAQLVFYPERIDVLHELLASRSCAITPLEQVAPNRVEFRLTDPNGFTLIFTEFTKI